MRSRIALCLFLTLPGTGFAQTESILDRVLLLVDSMGFGPTSGYLMNVAVSAGAAPVGDTRRLRAGDTVIVGYPAGGAAIRATADASGLIVTPDSANAMATGLSAGIYPLGSGLYSLPPAAHISLFQQDAQNRALERLVAEAHTGIDASITNVLTSRRPELLASVGAIAQAQNHAFLFGDIQSTAIGAVNASQILIHARLGATDFGGLTLADLTGADIAQSMNASLQEAATTLTHARTITQNAAATGAHTVRLALNAASNAQAVSGAVVNIVENQSLHVRTIVATAIGAVNGGSVWALD